MVFFLNKSTFPFFRLSQFSFLSICPSSGWSTGRQSRQDYQLSQIFKRDFLEWIMRTVLIGKRGDALVHSFASTLWFRGLVTRHEICQMFWNVFFGCHWCVETSIWEIFLWKKTASSLATSTIHLTGFLNNVKTTGELVLSSVPYSESWIFSMLGSNIRYEYACEWV